MLTPEEEARAVYTAYEIWQAVKYGFRGTVYVKGTQEFMATVERHLRPLMKGTDVQGIALDMETARELAAVEHPELN